MKLPDGGKFARTAGLVISTSIATAAINNTTWTLEGRAFSTLAVIAVCAFLAALASDYGSD